MVICFKCSPSLKSTIDALLQSGAYADYSELIAAAIENFAVLHEEVSKKGSIVLAGTESQAPIPRGRPQGKSGESVVSSPIGSRSHVETPPEAFRRPETAADGLSFAPLPSDVFFPGQPVPIDRWIFGQFSKLLPAKASCRALAGLYPPPTPGLELDKVAHEIARDAEVLSAFLTKLDKKRGLSRDDAWAVGFPSAENNADRSRLRYSNQFVGSIGKQGTLGGLLIDLKLINLSKAGTSRILLTQPGWDFAVMENPALDGILETGKFSAREVSFLLEHIQKNVPVEDFAYRAILRAIREGHNTPDKVDEICKRMTEKRKPGITDAFITTQRSGAVARMIDLNLVSRIREGVRVSYALTDRGEQYADSTKAA